LKPNAPAPNTNHLLASLPPEVARQLAPSLSWVELPQAATLHEVGDVLQHVYFPVTAIVSLVSTMQDGGAVEVAMVGNEGVVGVCAFIGGERTHSAATVQGAGHAWRMPAAAIAAHAAQSPALLQALMRYAQALFAQMTQTSACNRHHRLEQQLCRWLLMQLDRRDSPELVATQERIAGLLGVRREGVTASALTLQKAGLIRYTRGHIAVLDREGLESRSCECYAVIRETDDRLRAAPEAGRRIGSAMPPQRAFGLHVRAR
jgi:CRP-like cAMP-binding protein